jgi:hypothetical protein
MQPNSLTDKLISAAVLGLTLGTLTNCCLRFFGFNFTDSTKIKGIKGNPKCGEAGTGISIIIGGIIGFTMPFMIDSYKIFPINHKFIDY